MNHRIYIVLTACVFGGGAMIASLNACGDDDPVITGGEDGGETSSSGSTSSGSTSSGSTSGGTSGTSSGDVDGGGDGGASSSGGAVSNPGKVTCGASECTIATQICCRGMNDAGCVDGNNCPGNAAEIECDEKADCPDQDDVCCWNFGNGGGGGGGIRARCDDNCQRQATACKTAAECGDAGCIEKTCAGIRVRTCGPAGPGCQ